MALTNTLQGQLLSEKMRYVQEKQRNTSDNLARSGVAGEKTKEIESFSKAIKRSANPASVKRTHSNHLTGSVKSVGFRVRQAKDQPESSLTGNSISAEEQLLALNEAATEFYRLQQIHNSEEKRIKDVLNMGGGK